MTLLHVCCTLAAHLQHLGIIRVPHVMHVSDFLPFAHLADVIRFPAIIDNKITAVANPGAEHLLVPTFRIYDAALLPPRCPALLLYPFQSSNCGGLAIRHHHGFRCPIRESGAWPVYLYYLIGFILSLRAYAVRHQPTTLSVGVSGRPRVAAKDGHLWWGYWLREALADRRCVVDDHVCVSIWASFPSIIYVFIYGTRTVGPIALTFGDIAAVDCAARTNERGE